MQPGALKALEFDRIAESVRRYAQTPGGRAALARLAPLADPRAVAAALDETAETARFLGESPIGLRAPDDFGDVLEGLTVDGRALEPLQLTALAVFLESVDRTCAAIRRTRGGFPLLRAIADTAAAFTAETAAIRRAIDASGEVVDDASPELRSIRDRLRRQRARLRGTLESFLRGKDTARYLQQQIVTDRNGRYVLVVRAEHRGAIPGIVHGSSGTGASLFLEPLGTVEINNDIVELEQAEAEEIHRILLALTDAVRHRREDLDRTVEAATRLDVLQARASAGRLIDGVRPVIASDGRVELRGARHPLLVPAMRRHLGDAREGAADGPVPVDILIVPPVQVVVITGPNTGGKTVAIKTAGLLTLMAQAGLLIPAEHGSQITVFQSVFADIGDEQSIAESLSTFSGHIANIVSMERELALPALVLLDEAGAGTDPVEGGALATATIDHFRRRGATVMATTHYDALKTYAATTPGVVAASFGFDPKTFAPTYRIAYGVPGSSLAFEIAARLGLPAEILDHARTLRSEREAQLADHLAKVQRDMQALDHERRLLAREREQLAGDHGRVLAREQELRSREDAFRRRQQERIDERLREARREIDAVVDQLKARAGTLAADAQHRAARLIPTGETGAARARARADLEAIGRRLKGEEPAAAAAVAAPAAPGRPPVVGDRVLVGALKLEGTVKSLQGQDAEVDVRGKRMRVRAADLRVVGGRPSQPAPVRVHVDLQPREGSLTELNLIGCKVDEAIERTERFLDDTLVNELRSVRLVHGYGTGQLRRGIAEFLKNHPLVARFGPADADHGGGGVTVVELKD
jgi:DNA mismatch repair protein MutS2